ARASLPTHQRGRMIRACLEKSRQALAFIAITVLKGDKTGMALVGRGQTRKTTNSLSDLRLPDLWYSGKVCGQLYTGLTA
ncbi:MAG: hypothetical protein AAFP08_15190, partial [Bacteroidota bacterium]